MAKRTVAAAQLNRLERRVRFFNRAVIAAFFVVCAGVGFVVVTTAFPQRRELVRLEGKLLLAKEREAAVLADRDYHNIEYRALREDPAFLEIHARDRLDYYREGEKIFRFRDKR